MIAYPKRLIEVDLPIKRISAHARREKSIRHGHISTLHIWWARRPLAACRAVICATLWPDPVDEDCPPAFRRAAARALCDFAEAVRTSEELAALCRDSWTRWLRTTPVSLDPDQPKNWFDLRYALLDFIADFANWDASTIPAFLETARKLTQAAHEALGGIPGSRPLVVDPFAGGGSIPLEALRVGADAFASDLNPVAVLLNKVVLEYIPKFGHRLSDAVGTWGTWVKEHAERELAEFYPCDDDGATPIAYLWARTIRCEGPACGAELPLIRSLWLAKRRAHSVALRMVPDKLSRVVNFEIVRDVRPTDVGEGSVRRGAATCPCCEFTTSPASIRRQLISVHGGAADARLLAVATTHTGQRGRTYRLPNDADRDAVTRASEELRRRIGDSDDPVSLVPDERLPIMSGVFNAPIYGHETWGSLFMPRQALALTTLVRFVRAVGEELANDGDRTLADAVQTCLALSIDKVADLANSLCAWEPVAECPRHLFGRQAIPIVWDFAEGAVTGESSGSWSVLIDRFVHVLDQIGSDWPETSPHQSSATENPLPDDLAQYFFTDPPYYNAVPYADLSDFFYVWLKRSIGDVHPSLFRLPLSPKVDEICEMAGWDPVRYPEKNGQWFEEKMRAAMSEGRRVLSPDGVGIVVFAHKSTSGWEALLQAMVDAGWTITGSWPIDTEMGTRLRAADSAVLASSVHLVCRPRESSVNSAKAGDVGDWRDVLGELPKRIHEWLPRLVAEGVVGADAIFACLGPALEFYSRYSRVEKASGEQVKLGEYLEHVWAAVAREALSLLLSDADATGLEPDARLTAMWLWTLSAAAGSGGAGANEDDESDEDEAIGGKLAGSRYALEFDAARKIAQGLGANLDKLGHVLEVKGDTARLLTAAERTHYLFGKEGAQASPPSRKPRSALQLSMFEELAQAEEETAMRVTGTPTPGSTALDRVHQAMILFGGGRSEALKRLLIEDGIGRGRGFWSLAQSLSALYPAGSQEKRWVDGVLARKTGLGF